MLVRVTVCGGADELTWIEPNARDVVEREMDGPEMPCWPGGILNVMEPVPGMLYGEPAASRK